jgi:hypothetical protein
LSNPTATKTRSTKKLKEVTATKFKTGLRLQKFLCLAENTPPQQVL